MSTVLKLATACVFAFLTFSAASQNFADDYKPARNINLPAGLLKEINSRYDSLVRNVELSRKSRKFVQQTIDYSKKRLYTLDTAGLLEYQDTLTGYLQAIANRVQKNNPLLANRKYTVFTYRSSVPNATNRGAGVILVNLDLLAKLKTESGIAMVICHEIAHDIKGHVMESLIRATELSEDPEFDMAWKKIKKQEYGRFKAYEALMLKFASKYSEHSRSHELQADSLGLVLYANAGYAAQPAIKTIQFLDSIDTPAYAAHIDFMKYLNFTSCPFKNSWLVPETEESIGGNIVSTKLPDSLKTHPDCKVRVEQLQKLVPSIKFQQGSDRDTYAFYRSLSQFEEIELLYEDYEYSKALYNALQLLTVYPNNIYLKSTVANCLYDLYLSQKDHYYSMVSDYPSERYCESYNEMLVYLQNVNSDILRNQAIGFFNANLRNAASSSFAGYVAIRLKSLDVPKENRHKLVNEYKSAYSDAYYIKLLQQEFKPIKNK